MFLLYAIQPQDSGVSSPGFEMLKSGVVAYLDPHKQTHRQYASPVTAHFAEVLEL